MATVVFGDFEWDSAKAAANRLKHRVSFEEATTAFVDPEAIDAPDLTYADRVILLGRSDARRLLFVVYIERGDRSRVISARVATRAQRRRYEETEG